MESGLAIIQLIAQLQINTPAVLGSLHILVEFVVSAVTVLLTSTRAICCWCSGDDMVQCW